MKHLRMELNCIKLLFFIFHCSYRAVICPGRNFKAGSFFGNVVVMTHPTDCFWRNSLEQGRVSVYMNLNFSVFAHRGFFYLSAKLVHHKLRAVADSQDRDSEFVNFFCIRR